MKFETEIELNGQSYKLAYDWDAQVKAEEILEINLLSPQGLSASAVLRGLLFARLLKYQPEMTQEKATELMRTNVGIIAAALNEIGEYQTVDPEKEEVLEA